MEQRLSTLIIGGGIGGLTTALALARRGRRAHVVEKAPEFGEIGAGLQLAPNAMWVLDELGVAVEIAKHAVFPSRLVFMDALTAEPITAIDVSERFRSHYGQPYLVLHRSDLLNVLLAACQAEALITLEAGRDVAEVQDCGDYARAKMIDGSTLEADVIIGADGLWSRVRRLIIDDEPVGSHYVAYRGAIPMDRMSAHAGLDSVVMWVGPEMHFVQYPIRRGELYNQVAVFRSPRYAPDSDDWGTAEELDAHFVQTCGYVRDSIAMGGFFHLDGIAAQVRNQIMSGRAADDFSMIDWLYGHRV